MPVESEFCEGVTDDLDAAICRELVEEFRANCPLPIESEAMPLLRDLLSRGVLAARRNNGLEWEGYTQKFFLFATASLGRELQKRAGPDGPVRLDDVVAVASALNSCWRRVCPIPSTDGGMVEFGDCFSSGLVAEHLAPR